MDIVQVDRIDASLARFGERFPRKILTPFELTRFAGARRESHFLAKHFAAKEACAKALGTGFSRGVALRTIEVRNEPGGRPYLICYGATRELMLKLGIVGTYLSLSDERDYALAQVTLEA